MTVEMASKKLPDWTACWRKDPIMSSTLLMKVYTWTRIQSFYNLFSKANPIGKTCLEIGAGTGYISKLLAQKYRLDTTLIDNNREAYEMFQKVSKEGRYILIDAFSFNPDEKFDIAFSDGLIEHFYHKERMEMILLHKNLVKADGYVMIFVPKNSWFVTHLCDWKGGLEFKYNYSQLEKELTRASLEPVARTEDWHMIGVLSKIM
jgi:cyclopropane fatty-acyl-phospholipid synthase-like methyltransferase